MTSLIDALWICWTSVTLALAGLVIYRSLVAMKEEDQLFLDPAEWQLEQEQRAILTQLDRLAPVVKGFAVASIALLGMLGGLWVYRSSAGFIK